MIKTSRLAKILNRDSNWIIKQMNDYPDFPRRMIRGSLIHDLQEVCVWLEKHLPE